MSGRRLLQSLSRRRSTFQSVNVCAFNRNGIYVLSADWTPWDRGIFHGTGVLPNDFFHRIREYLPCMPHGRLYSVCSDRIALYDGGSETCIHQEQDSHDTSRDHTPGDQIINQTDDGSRRCKSRRAKRSKISGTMEGHESLSLPKSQEGHNIVESKDLRALKPALENGSYEVDSTQSSITKIEW